MVVVTDLCAPPSCSIPSFRLCDHGGTAERNVVMASASIPHI